MFFLHKPDGTKKLCHWAPWFYTHAFYGPLYDENLQIDSTKLLIKSDFIRAYGVEQRDDSWDPDSKYYVRHFPPLFFEPEKATYIIYPGDIIEHQNFRITLKEDLHSYFTLDHNLRTEYDLQML